MAARPSATRPWRALLVLLIVTVGIYGALFLGTKFSDASPLPQLALDLEGGTQIILTPRSTDGQDVSADDLAQAISIIRQRVDASGVAEAEITSQGGQNIVVALPGTPSQETLDLVRTSAQMRFRPVLVETQPGPITDLDGDGQPDPEPTVPAEELSDVPATEPTSPSDLAWITPAVERELQTLDCTDPANRVGGGGDDPATALVTCSVDGTVKYVLGPVEIEGTEIASASSGLRTTSQGVVTNEWIVQLEFTGEGTGAFSESTQRLVGLTPPQNQFAMVLDGLVISAPAVNDPITNGSAEISGSFTRETAATLASQLNFGSLPLTFEVQSEEQISATLGSEQLQRGLLAGAIGLLLVVIYSFFQYRGLAVVTLTSLLVAGVITFGVIGLLSWLQGYRLSLPGVAGLIVAIGITADSFIVYFERIRDEVREGRYLEGAVEAGWVRARRTILASDAVNFLAAIVLYLLAVGGVRGFAFTLGLTTLVDVFVVFFFTHPLMQLLDPDEVLRRRPPAVRAGSRPPRRVGEHVPRSRAVRTARRVAQAHDDRRTPCRGVRWKVGRGARHRGRRRDEGRGALMPSFAQFGNDLYTGKRSYDIIGKRRRWFILFLSLVALSLALLLVREINPGIEFRGGSEFVVSGTATLDEDLAGQAVAQISPDQIARVSTIGGSAVRIQTEELSSEQTDELRSLLAEAYGVPVENVTSSFVGPSWGADVTRKAIQGLITFLVLVALVMAAYFRTWTMAVAAIVALLNDLVITVGLYAGVGFEVTPATVIGLLTILGYSLYDTVVVFDKVRENTAHVTEQTRYTYGEAANLAVNQTLVRSINTSIVGLLPVASILFVGALLLGAGTLRDIALALFIGMIASTVSSIFVATPLEVTLRQRSPVIAAHTAKVLALRAAKAAAAGGDDTRTPVPAGLGGLVAGGHQGQAAQPRRKARR